MLPPSRVFLRVVSCAQLRQEPLKEKGSTQKPTLFLSEKALTGKPVRGATEKKNKKQEEFTLKRKVAAATFLLRVVSFLLVSLQKKRYNAHTKSIGYAQPSLACCIF